jgi:hypothetical protein
VTVEKPRETTLIDRVRQIWTALSFIAKRDRRFAPLVSGAALIPLALTVVAVNVGGWLWLPVGVLLTVLAVLVVVRLRGTAAVMDEMEREPGAAVQLVESMRGWRVTPAIGSTSQLDMVHLVIGYPGVVLLAEGHPQRARNLLIQQKKRLSEVVDHTPLYEYVVGRGENELSIRRLRTTLMRLPRSLASSDVEYLDRRLSSLGRGGKVDEREASGPVNPGEIVWTWVEYEDDPEQGKERPVLVVGRRGGILVGLALSSNPERDGQPHWLALGPGPWDRKGRPSWVRLDQAVEIDGDSIRRNGAVLDQAQFNSIVNTLRSTYRWRG